MFHPMARQEMGYPFHTSSAHWIYWYASAQSLRLESAHILLLFLPVFAVITQVRLRVAGYMGYSASGGPASESGAATVGLSVAVNIMVTGLILYKLFRTSLKVSNALPHSKPHHMYRDVATAIIESAAPLAFFGTCFAIVLVISYYQPPQRLLSTGALNTLNEVLSTTYHAFVVSTESRLQLPYSLTNTLC